MPDSSIGVVPPRVNSVDNIPNRNYSSKRNDSDKTIDYRGQGDLVMAQVRDLIDDSKYLPYFYKRLNALGPTKFMALADEARKVGFKPSRKFVQLLKYAYDTEHQ